MSLIPITVLTDPSTASQIESNGLAEVVLRRANSQYRSMIKCPLVDNSRDDFQQLANAALRQSSSGTGISELKHAVQGINRNVSLNHGYLSKISADVMNLSSQVDQIYSGINIVQSLSFLNVGLGLANIAVSAAGYYILSKKLSTMENNLKSELDSLSTGITDIKSNQVNEKYGDFRKLILRYNSLSVKIQNHEYVSADSLDTLLTDINRFYNEILMDYCNKSYPAELSLNILFTLLGAYSALFDYFLYSYFDEHYSSSCVDPLPPNYTSYLQLYVDLLSDKFNKVTFNYLFLNEKMHYVDTINALTGMNPLVLKYSTDVIDRADIISKIHDRQEIRKLDESISASVEKYAAETLPDLATSLGYAPDVSDQFLKVAKPYINVA